MPASSSCACESFFSPRSLLTRAQMRRARAVVEDHFRHALNAVNPSLPRATQARTRLLFSTPPACGGVVKTRVRFRFGPSCNATHQRFIATNVSHSAQIFVCTSHQETPRSPPFYIGEPENGNPRIQNESSVHFTRMSVCCTRKSTVSPARFPTARALACCFWYLLRPRTRFQARISCTSSPSL